MVCGVFLDLRLTTLAEDLESKTSGFDDGSDEKLGKYHWRTLAPSVFTSKRVWDQLENLWKVLCLRGLVETSAARWGDFWRSTSKEHPAVKPQEQTASSLTWPFRFRLVPTWSKQAQDFQTKKKEPRPLTAMNHQEKPICYDIPYVDSY